jgi:large subunit ribosomal protein L25
MHSLEVECPAENIIEQIAININNLHLGQSIYVKDIPTSEGIKILNDPDVVVVHVVRKAQETEVEAEPTTSAEPELIRRPAAEKTESDE